MGKLAVRLAWLATIATMPESVTAQHLVAHRGASHDAPENTLAAFRLAWQQGADGVEGDFHLTADGQIVCIHDPDTRKVAGQKLVVKDATLAELQALDVGSWKNEKYRGERPPTLSEVLATVPAGKLFFVEVKCGVEIVPPLERVLTASGLDAEQVVIISFDADAIAACARQMPAYRTQWLTSCKRTLGGAWRPTAEEVIAKLKSSGAHGLGCKAQRGCFDAEFVAALRQAGYANFGVWTVDDPQLAEHYRKIGAWSITTNRPSWLRSQLLD